MSVEAVVAQLEGQLQQLQTLKPPGATKSSINSIATLCVDHVRFESDLIQKIYTCFKKFPSTHKLGILYIIDQVTRQYIEKIPSEQELSGTAAPEGTFASGVQRLTGLLPILINDFITSAPDEHKEKLWKLVDIWSRAQTFPASMLAEFKQKLDGYRSTAVAPSTSQVPSTQTHASTQAREDVLANMTPEQADALAAVIPAHVMANAEALAEHLKLLQRLTEMGVTQDKWPSVIAALQEQNSQKQSGQPKSASLPSSHNGTGSRPRSRSPPEHHPSPLPGNYGSQNSGYRERSPVNRGHSPSLQEDKILLSEPKWTDYDPTVPEGCIKVYSRTIFCGGTAVAEGELRQIFSRWGEVQTVTINRDKHNAFIKMCYREGAVAAIEGMNALKNPEILDRVRSTKWGVGFGPRECCNYNTGVSIIPINRFTEADNRWLLTAKYGGTGGKPVQTGLVIEEPDIEIGAGVSSKAISRRLETHADPPRRGSGNKPLTPPARAPLNPPPSGRRNPPRPRTQDHYSTEPPRASTTRAIENPSRYEVNSIGVPAPVPGFGFQLPTTNPRSTTMKRDRPGTATQTLVWNLIKSLDLGAARSSWMERNLPFI